MYKNKDILNSFYTAADAAHRRYNTMYINSIDGNRIIGVRTPKLRAMARDMLENGTWRDFIADLPHHFFEENQLHAFIISEIKDFDFVIDAVDRFLPYVDNWATSDQMSPKIFAKNTKKLLPYINKWIKSDNIYAVRFAIICLMRYYLTDRFDEKYVRMVADIKSKEYYINMARAWYFATAAAKQFDTVLPYFAQLDLWTRTRAIEKSFQSYRVDEENKLKLKEFRQRIKDEQRIRCNKKSSIRLRNKQEFTDF